MSIRISCGAIRDKFPKFGFPNCCESCHEDMMLGIEDVPMATAIIIEGMEYSCFCCCTIYNFIEAKKSSE